MNLVDRKYSWFLIKYKDGTPEISGDNITSFPMNKLEGLVHQLSLFLHTERKRAILKKNSATS